MIRINLLGRAKSRRRIGASLPDVPNVGILLFVLLMVIEAASLYTMHADASEQAEQLSRKVKRVKKQLGDTKIVQARLTAVRKELSVLKKQALVFEELQAEKRGPVGALSYLSFILKPRDEATDPAEALKQLEAVGWRVSWDSGRAWFTRFREERGTVTLKGEALSHDDVAEVLRRLESAAHYRNVKLAWQERRADSRLKKEFVTFSAKADLLYLVEPYLTAEQREAKAEAEAEKKAAEEAAAAEAAAAEEQAQSPEPKEDDKKDKPKAAAKGQAPEAKEGAAAAAPPQAASATAEPAEASPTKLPPAAKEVP